MTITAKQVNSQLRSSTAQFGEGPAQWVILSYRQVASQCSCIVQFRRIIMHKINIMTFFNIVSNTKICMIVEEK